MRDFSLFSNRGFSSPFPCGIRLWPVLALVLAIGASCSVVTSYPESVKGSLAELATGNFEKACAGLQDGTTSTLDSLVYLLEQGTCFHAMGEYKRSNEVFLKAAAQIKEEESKATISLTGTGSEIASLVVNEKTIPYAAESYEKVLLHSYLAMNFILLDEPEEARVEIRQMEDYLRDAQKRLEDEAGLYRGKLKTLIEPTSTAAGDQPPAGGAQTQEEDLLKATGPLFDALNAVIDRVPDACRLQDAFAHYLSSIVYQMNAKGAGATEALNDAYIDMKQVYELMPDASFLGRDLLRLSAGSKILDEYARWKSAFPGVQEPPAGVGDLVVFFENGSAPWKDQASIMLPVGGGLTKTSLPVFRLKENGVARLTLTDTQGPARRTSSLLTDVEGIAVKSLKDRMSVIVLKQALRTTAKAIGSSQAQKYGGAMAGLGASLALSALEQADQRSWLSLPQNIQVIKVPMGPGRYRLKLTLEDASGRGLDEKEFEVEIAQGQVSVVNCRSMGGKILSIHTEA